MDDEQANYVVDHDKDEDTGMTVADVLLALGQPSKKVTIFLRKKCSYGFVLSFIY